MIKPVSVKKSKTFKQLSDFKTRSFFWNKNFFIQFVNSLLIF